MQDAVILGEMDDSGDFLTAGKIENHRGGISTELEHGAEECGHAPELVLTPLLVRMIVALRAIQAASHENADLLAHGVLRRREDQVWQVMPRRSAIALSGDALYRHLV